MLTVYKALYFNNDSSIHFLSAKNALVHTKKKNNILSIIIRDIKNRQ